MWRRWAMSGGAAGADGLCAMVADWRQIGRVKRRDRDSREAYRLHYSYNVITISCGAIKPPVAQPCSTRCRLCAHAYAGRLCTRSAVRKSNATCPLLRCAPIRSPDASDGPDSSAMGTVLLSPKSHGVSTTLYYLPERIKATGQRRSCRTHRWRNKAVRCVGSTDGSRQATGHLIWVYACEGGVPQGLSARCHLTPPATAAAVVGSTLIGDGHQIRAGEAAVASFNAWGSLPSAAPPTTRRRRCLKPPIARPAEADPLVARRLPSAAPSIACRLRIWSSRARPRWIQAPKDQAARPYLSSREDEREESERRGGEILRGK
uniref:Uncharacterized protein n=1 Tax=Oryza glumipatula TaxID=40148 RepID=A0A0D9ZVG6_9ORYZ